MRTLLGLLLIAAPAWSQALVEYGLGAAAAGTAGGAASASRGIAGVFSNLANTLNSTTGQATTAASTTSAPAKSTAAKAQTATVRPAAQVKVIAPPPAPEKPAVVYEDPVGIKVGMDQTELISRFGEPTFKITGGSSGSSLTYETKERVVEVVTRDGKVYSVQAKSRARQAAVVLLQ